MWLVFLSYFKQGTPDYVWQPKVALLMTKERLRVFLDEFYLHHSLHACMLQHYVLRIVALAEFSANRPGICAQLPCIKVFRQAVTCLLYCYFKPSFLNILLCEALHVCVLAHMLVSVCHHTLHVVTLLHICCSVSHLASRCSSRSTLITILYFYLACV